MLVRACQVDEAPPAVCALDWEESAGISAPLYDIVDVVFELRSRGFFRRQVQLIHNPQSHIPPVPQTPSHGRLVAPQRPQL